MATNKFAIREAKEADFPFIYSTWLKGLRYGNEVFGWIDQKKYFEVYHQVIEKILNHPDTFILVACLNDDPDTILGYSVRTGESTLHYVHVKDAFRRFGIGKSLTPEKLDTVTHLTKVGKAILTVKFPKASFNPFL